MKGRPIGHRYLLASRHEGSLMFIAYFNDPRHDAERQPRLLLGQEISAANAYRRRWRIELERGGPGLAYCSRQASQKSGHQAEHCGRCSAFPISININAHPT